jgi:transposase
MNVRYRVELSQIERDELTAMLGGGKHAARKLKRAQILLAADAGCCDAEIVRTVRVSLSSVGRTKRRFVEGNLERALCEEPRPGAERKLTGKEEALLVATACAKPPAGRKRWTLTLLADTMVKLTDHDSLSGETVRRRLAENDLKPWRRDMWCIPHVDGEYVARMEDVLDLYAGAPDPARPLVCFDETPVQLIGEVRQPIPAQLGQRERYDYEYRRNGTVNLRYLRPASWLAQRQGDRPPRRRRLRTLHARTRRRPLSRRRLHSCRAGQSVDPYRRRAVSSFCACRGPSHPAPPRIPLHPETRKLAQHGRVRDQRATASMSRPSHRRPQKAPKRDHSMATAAKQNPRAHQMDVHNRQSPRQTPPRLSNHRQRVKTTVMNH